MTTRPAAVVVLAAGEGTRMRSRTPKVLHTAAGRTLLHHVVAAGATLQPEHLVVVVGHGRDLVTEHLGQVAPSATTAVQEQPNGTGHAVRAALATLPELTGVVVVLPGDAPLLTEQSLAALVERHHTDGAATTLLTAQLVDPTGYGRVVRGEDGGVAAVVEQRDADEATLAVREVATSVYAFDAAALAAALGRLTTDNAQGEEYLTDVVADHVAAGLTVSALAAADPAETAGVNDKVQLAAARRVLNDRLVEAAMRAGADVVDPATTWIDVDVLVEADAVLLPGVQLLAGTVVRAGATVGPDATLTATEVGPGARVTRAHCDHAVVGPGASVGPYAYLRPGAVLAAGSKVGTYVEVKNSSIGPGAKVPHLTYVGDAEIGEGTNIGAASVFVNYDGVAKHRTVVGAHARTGSDTMFVAPVTVGDGAYTAAGSVITEDVPPGAMAVARGRQRNIDGWVARRRPGTPSARAAQAAQAGEAGLTSGVAPAEAAVPADDEAGVGGADGSGTLEPSAAAAIPRKP